jgi:aspartyl-tRNA(Asn)/glutamyl-tRNA(Gln) amidotransferase subunit A
MKYYAVKMCDNGNIAVDNTILVKGVESTSGSHILEGFKPLFSAEAVTRLENKGYTVSGKTNVGEFGLDLVGEFSYYAPQEEKLTGAAATLVAQGEVKAALGVDMNGATRRSAALANIDFLKPTYGTVSRYGVISCAVIIFSFLLFNKIYRYSQCSGNSREHVDSGTVCTLLKPAYVTTLQS